MPTKVLAKIQLTQEGYDEIVRELKELEEVKRPEIVTRVAIARSNGDLSENAEYHNAKEDQDLLETRIAELQGILQQAVVVSSHSKKSTVSIGSVVIAEHTVGKAKKKQAFHIVGEFEADPKNGKISSVSPIGKAMMGKKKGDTAKVETPGGHTEYKILEIE